MRTSFIQYYVEGEDDKKVIEILKSKMALVKPGKIQVLNVIEKELTNKHLRLLSSGTMVVLVFDTDTQQIEVLTKNLEKLHECSSVSDVVTVPQVPNLEGELMRSCNIKRIKELIGCKSNKDFKRDVIRISNLDAKLKEHGFSIERFWSSTPSGKYKNIENLAWKIKKCRNA